MSASAKSTTLFIVACLLLVFLASGSALAQRGISVSGAKPSDRRVALVMGNARYQNSPLRNPVNDARLMARTLKSLGFEVIEGENLSLRAMKRAVQRFGKSLDRGGVGLFYYAGHAVQVDGLNYLIPIGAQIDSELDVELESLDLRRVLVEMAEAKNRLNLVFLDSCRNNPYARSFRAPAKGLAQMNAPSGTLISFATGPGKTAADGDGKHGIFTEELAKNITRPGVMVESALKLTRVAVSRRTGGKQVPWDSSSLTGNFYFKPGKAGQRPLQLAGGRVTPRVEPAPAPKPEPAKPGPAGAADLYVSTEPGQAMIYLDGVQKGRSPQTLEMVPAGRHVIIARKGYLVAYEELTLVRDDLKKLHLKLEHQKGDLKLFSDPPGAEVRLDGQVVCKATPCKVAGVKAGKRRLVVVLWKGNQCWDYRSEVAVSPGGNRLSLELKRNIEAERKRKAEAERKRLAQEKARAEAARREHKEAERKRREAARIVERSSDGRYTKTANGVITDSRTGLQWFIGPDKGTNWYDAKKWVEGLSVAGGGWRMPSPSELKGISQKGARNSTPKCLPLIFNTTGFWVWSGKTRDSTTAWGLNFQVCGEGWGNRQADNYDFVRAFAVRAAPKSAVSRKPRNLPDPKKEPGKKDKTVERSSYGRFVKDAKGVITDSRTGLQWFVEPDKNTNWYNAKKWVTGLKVAGGGWRMPSLGELRGIYERNKAKNSMDPIFGTTGWWVWSGEAEGSSEAWLFYFHGGKDLRYDRNYADRNGGVFAVRAAPKKELGPKPQPVVSQKKKPGETAEGLERSSDGRLTKDADGVISDSRTGLQWYVGPMETPIGMQPRSGWMGSPWPAAVGGCPALRNSVNSIKRARAAGIWTHSSRPRAGMYGRAKRAAPQALGASTSMTAGI